jgi:hypothetical protein
MLRLLEIPFRYFFNERNDWQCSTRSRADRNLHTPHLSDPGILQRIYGPKGQRRIGPRAFGPRVLRCRGSLAPRTSVPKDRWPEVQSAGVRLTCSMLASLHLPVSISQRPPGRFCRFTLSDIYKPRVAATNLKSLVQKILLSPYRSGL